MSQFVQGSIQNPAAGADLAITPVTGEAWRLLTLRATLTTAVAVANRVPHFQIIDQSGTVVHEIVAVAAETASSVVTYQLTCGNGAPYQGGAAFDGVSGIALPDIWFPAGFKIKTATTAIAAADQWSAISWALRVGDEYEHLALLREIAGSIGG